MLSQRLLHDIGTLNQQEQQKTTTRVEVEVVEDVTIILKTYIIGKRNDLFQDFLVGQAAVDATSELSQKFLVEGQHYEDHSEIRPYQRTSSEATTVSDSITQRRAPSPRIECTLKRMEDRSFNEVNVAMSNVFSAVLFLIREPIIPQLPSHVSYGMEQHGKQYSGETTIRRLHRFESTDSFDEGQKTSTKEPSFLFEKPQIIETVKIPLLNITELDLRRMADTSAILANFAIPRTDQSQLDIESDYDLREAGGGSYGIEQKGQHFKDEMIFKKKPPSLESESVSEEDICGLTYLNLTKQEARGEFEVTVTISNDQRGSPKHFHESQPTEVINLITQISTDGKKEEILVTFATKPSCREVYVGQEMSSVTSNAIIAIQKTIRLDDIFQQYARSWNDKTVERITQQVKATTEEAAMLMLSIGGYVGKYSNGLVTEFIMKDVRTHKTDLCSRASLESERVSNVSLNRGSKMLAASVRLSERVKQNEQMTITEFGDEREQVVIFLQRAGIINGQVQREWSEAVTGRSRSTCTTSSTTTTTKTLNIFESFTDSFSTMTNTDFPSTDLTKTNTTTKHFHLSNFKTILPTHSIAQKVFRLIDITAVSMDLCTNYTQEIPESSDEIRVRIAHELCNADEIKQNINEEEERLQVLVKTISSTSKGDDNEGQLEEIFNIFQIAGDINMHEVSIIMRPQRSRSPPRNDLSDEVKNLSLSLHGTIQCMQSGTELSFSSDSHKKSSERATVNVENTKKLPETTGMLMNETKIEGRNDTRNVFPEPKEERVVPIKQTSVISSSNVNSREKLFTDVREQWTTKIYDSSYSLETSYSRSFDDADSYRTTSDLFRGKEYVNSSRRMKKTFEESSPFENVSHNVNHWQESMSRYNNTREVSLTWNSVDRSREQQLKCGKKGKRMSPQEFLYDTQQKEQQQLHTFQRVKQKELKGKLYNTTSEKRVAMLHAGFDLDMALLTTPEMETQLTFAKDRRVTTNEYFSDERSWTVTTESCNQQNIHTEQISQCAGDLFESSLKGDSEALDEMSLISDTTYSRIKHSEINLEKINLQMIHSLITSPDSSTSKILDVEFSTVPETYKYDVAVRKSEQYEASSIIFSTGYYDFIQPKRTVEEALVVKKKETDLKIYEPREKRDSTSFCERNIRHIQTDVLSLDLEYQDEIFQQTTNKTIEIMEATEHVILESVQDKNVRTGTVETHKQQLGRHNASKIDYYQTIPQVFSTASKIIAELSVPEQEIHQTNDVATSSEVIQRTKAQSEPASINRELSTMTSGETDNRFSFEERNSQFDIVVHFPLKPMKKLLLRAIAPTEKAKLITEDEIGAVTKTPEAKMTCTVDAVKYEDADVVERIEQLEFLEFAGKTISLKVHVSENDEWKNIQGSAEALFQQVAREAIISTGYFEEQTAAFQEYGSTSTGIVANFARILIKKTKNEAKISNNLSRHWEEYLDLESCVECIANLEKLLVEVEIEIVKHSWSEIKVVIGLIAYPKMHETRVITLDNLSQCQSPKIALKDLDEERIISEDDIAQSEITKLIDITFATATNNFDRIINICEFNSEHVEFSTVASEVELRSKNMPFMEASHENSSTHNASTHFCTITVVSGDKRQFRIEPKIKESILACEQELFAGSVQKAVLSAENLTESAVDSSEMRSNAGILLSHHSEAASRVVDIALTLSERLKTQYTLEATEEASVEFSIPASNLGVEGDVQQSAISRDVANLETKYAKAIALQEAVELIKSREVLAETESILKGAHTDTVLEKLGETHSEGFEILSQWTTVDRDLEAEVGLLHTLNVGSEFSTVTTSEEETSIGEKWVATKCNMGTSTTKNVVASECCKRSFQIEFDEVGIWLENFEKEGSCEIFWCGKNYDMLYVTMRESILEKLNAAINLYRVSNFLPKQAASEYIWRDKRFLVALPLYVKCEGTETDYTTVDICLEQEVTQKYLEIVQIATNRMETEIFEFEEAVDEKLDISVELHGKRLAPLGAAVIWPKARKESGIIVDMEEYLEDQTTLYAELTSEQVTFAEFNTTIIVSEDYEPQMLITNTVIEEIVNGYDEFRIVPQEKTISHVMIIGNKGECLSIWLQETEQNFVTVGFQYSEEARGHEMEGNFVERRFGGNYQLLTKAAQVEDCNANVTMLRPTENETIIKVLKESVRSFLSIEVLAPTFKVTVIDVNWEKTPPTASAFIQRPCSRKAEPIKSCLLEIGEMLHTVHAQFRIKEASWKFSTIWKVPNYGGHFILNTESAEETVSDYEIEYHKNETSETTVKTLKQVITIVAVLSAQCVTEVEEEIRTDLVKPSLTDQAYLLLKQANMGVNTEVKLIETTDVRETSYLQLSREVQSMELEKIIKEVRFGGKLMLITSASEEYELNAVRELTDNVIRIAHCSQLIVSKNWNRNTCCEVIATKSESREVYINLRNLESIHDTNRTVWQKPLMRNTLRIQESEAVVLTVNLNHIKQTLKEISEKTMWLARSSEPCTITASATADEQKLVQCILQKRHDTFLAASARIAVKNTVKGLPLDAMQSEFVEIAICPNLQHIAELLEVCKTFKASSRGYDMHWKLYEPREQNECSNYQFKQENLMEQVETILRQPCYGGHLILYTSATKECMVHVTLRLQSKLPLEAETHCSINVSNKNIPAVFSTNSTISVENNETFALVQKPEAKEARIVKKIVNMDMAQLVAVEMSLETESVIMNCQHKEERTEIQATIFVAFYGGHQKLETLAAKEIITDIHKELVSDHLMLAESCLHQAVGNVASPCILSTQSSRFEESNEEYHLQKKLIFDNGTALMLPAANHEFSKFNALESTNEVETITTHWQHDGTYEEVRSYICDKRFGGSLILSTHFAQESSIVFAAALTASRSSLEAVIFTIFTVNHSNEEPTLTTSSTTEMFIGLHCHLNVPSVGLKSTIIIYISNHAKAMNAQLTESTTVSETTNVQYQRRDVIVDTFLEVFPEVRFGGSLILNTLASDETSISIESLHSPKGLKQIEVQLVFIENNRECEMYYMLATTKQAIATDLKFQKPSDLSGVEIMKRASRRGDDRCFTCIESSEISQFNNFFWRNPTETNAGQVAILKEIRHGGHLELSTGCATEQAITITNTLKQSLVELSSTLSMKTANRGESINVSCPASQENHVFTYMELQSVKLSQFEISISRKTAYREVPQKLITNESSELNSTTITVLQKSLGYESAEIVWKAKNQGGIIELHCSSSRQSYTEMCNCLESRLSLKEYDGAMLIIHEVRYGEHIAMNLMTTEETSFNFEISFEKQDVESEQSYTIKVINVALPEVLNTAESLESAIEIEKVEVWRRLSELHVESSLKLARQCLPVFLQADSAEETFIRHESEMCANVQHTNATAEIERSTIRTEREALTCTEAVNVTLRHKAVNEEQEEKVEKR